MEYRENLKAKLWFYPKTLFPIFFTIFYIIFNYFKNALVNMII